MIHHLRWPLGWKAGLAAALLFFFGFELKAAEPNAAEPVRRGWSMADWELTPIQAGGRTKPIAAFAAELVLHLTGKQKFEGWRPSEMLASMVSQPAEWRQKPLFKIDREDVKRQLLLDEKTNRFSAAELFSNSALLQYASRMGSALESTLAKAPDPQANPREEELKRVLDRLTVFHQLVTGEAWTVIPAAGGLAWQPVTRAEDREKAQALALAELLADASPQGVIRAKFVAAMGAYLSGDFETFAVSTRDLRQAVTRAAEELTPGFEKTVVPKLRVEKIYRETRPFHWAWMLYVLAALVFAVGGWLGQDRFSGASKTGLSVMGLALALHVFGFALRSYVAGRPPVSNMYESIVWVAFGAVVFALVIFVLQRKLILLGVGSILGAFGLLAADAAPTLMDPGLHPLVPVLRSNYWLTVHVLTITLGYAAFALSFGLGNVTLFKVLRGTSEHSAEVMGLNQLTYRAMQFGVVLLAAGTLLGGVWADYSWGRFWGWDPKEVWALIALLTYLIVLHGRYAGWVGQFGFAAWSVLCFSSVVMAWYGVNFVLGVGLHSYGFSAGGQGAVGTGVLLQFAFVAWVAFQFRRRRASNASS
ncbi:MAG: cytochrome c biogenesis protein [Oligoflexia bacterium]